MSDYLLQHQQTLFTYLLIGSPLLVALVESFVPARQLTHPLVHRWSQNIGLYVLNIALLRLLVPVAVIAWAVQVHDQGWGLVGLLELPTTASWIIAILLLDLGAYAQHRLVHAVPWFWRFHRVHHCDPDYDVTTGLRFHLFEVLITYATKLLIITGLGAPPEVIVIQEAIFIVTTFIVHANLVLPPRVDRALRLVFVTPNMHRIHHSDEFDESNSNFSNTLSIWDRLFGSYCADARLPLDEMHIGLVETRGTLPSFIQLMRMPFIRVLEPTPTDLSTKRV